MFPKPSESVLFILITNFVIILTLLTSCTEVEDKIPDSSSEIDYYDDELTQIDSLFKAWKFKKALKKSKNLVNESNRSGNLYISGQAMIMQYQGYSYLEKYDSSNVIFSNLILYAEELSSLNKKKLLGKAYLSKAKIQQDLDFFDSSQVSLLKSREYLDISLPEDFAYSYILSTKAKYLQYDDKAALEYLKSAKKIIQQATLPIHTLNLIDNWYSLVLKDIGEYELSINHNENILRRLRNQSNEVKKTENPNLLLHTYQNLGAINYWKGDIDKGQLYYARALEYATDLEKVDSVEIAQLYNNMGVGSLYTNAYLDAKKYFRQAFELIKSDSLESREREILTDALLHYSFCLKNLGQADSALFFSHEALTWRSNTPNMLDYAYYNIGSVHLENGKYNSAIDTALLAKSEALKRYGPRNRFVGRAFQLQGEIYTKMNQYEKSIDAFQEALISFSKTFSSKDYLQNPEIGTIYDKKNILINLGLKTQALLSLYDMKPHIQDYLIASWETSLHTIKLIELIRQDFDSDKAKFHLLSHATPVYESSLRAGFLLDKGQQDPQLLTQAFNISEQGKSMILQDNMRSAFALQSHEIPEDLKRKEDSLRINIAFYGQRVRTFESKEKLSSYDSTQYKNALRIFLNSEEAYSNLLKTFEEKFPDYVDRKRAEKAPGLDTIFSYLDSTQASLIEYFWGEKALYAFVLHEGKIQMFELPKDEQLEKEMETWRNSISNATEVFNQGNSPEFLAAFKQSGYAMYQKILAPLLQNIPNGRNLVIVPDGPLNLFPFEALLYSDQDPSMGYEGLDYLLHHHQTQYALSASLLLKKYTSTHTNYGFLGYAPSYAETRRLDFNKQEVTQIAEMIEGKAVLGAKASKTHFKQQAHQARFLHLSQHAINEQDPLMSHLLFSPSTQNSSKPNELSEQVDPQKLYAYEIYNQKLSCELAVLNACETGKGTLIQGEGMLSLSRAFRHAGSESVIMNKWRANDEASFNIMAEFYALLSQGLNTASALREAKIKYLQNSNKTHPYFWAGSSLIGKAKKTAFKAQKRTKNADSNQKFFIGIGILGILFLLGLMIKLSSMMYPKHPQSLEDDLY